MSETIYPLWSKANVAFSGRTCGVPIVQGHPDALSIAEQIYRHLAQSQAFPPLLLGAQLISGLGFDYTIGSDDEIRDKLDRPGKWIIETLISTGMDDNTISTVLARSFTQMFRSERRFPQDL
jgi:hypothetical protein